MKLDSKKSILGLELPTDPRWALLTQNQLEDILTDHAYCEQKAASTCISLIVQYPDFPILTEKLSPIVTEEWGHFRLVMREITRRGLKFGTKRKDEYVNELFKLVRKGGNRIDSLLDKLLVSALIEARSCERFKVLSQQLEDENLQRFYYDLMVAEAGHYRLFLDLAKEVCMEDKVDSRWKEFLYAEAEIMKSITPRGDRIH